MCSASGAYLQNPPFTAGLSCQGSAPHWGTPGAPSLSPVKLCREQNSKQTGVRYIGIKGECSTQKHFGGGHDYVAHPNLLCSTLSIIISIVSHETCLFLCVSVASQRVTHTTVVHLILSGLGLRVVGCLCAAQAHILVSVVMAELFMLPNSRSPTYSNPI